MADPIEERVRRLEEAIARGSADSSGPKSKDVWDKLSALSTVLSGVIIASIGIWVNHSLTTGQQRAQDAQAEATREMEKAHNAAAESQAAQALKLQAQQAADSLTFQRQQASDSRQLESLRMEQQKQQAFATLSQQREHDEATLHLQQTQLARDLMPQMQGDAKTRSAALQLLAGENPKEALMLSVIYSETSADTSLQQTSAGVILALQKSADPAVSRAASEAQVKVELSRRIQAIVNVFESGQTRRDYGEISRENGRLTYGGFLAGGDLWEVVNQYCEKPGALQAGALRPYLDRLKEAEPKLEADSDFGAVLKRAADDPVMQKLQDDAFDHKFWTPIQADVTTFGLKLPLTVAMVHDATFSMGRNRVVQFANAAAAKVGGLPAQGADEKAWAAAFLEARRADDIRVAARMPVILKAFMRRVDFFQGMMDKGNWNLEPPFQVNGVAIS